MCKSQIIYYCYGGTHSSPTAAAIHVGLLSDKQAPSPQELFAIPYYDKVKPDQRGRVMPMGCDEDGNEVYIVGRGNEKLGICQGILSGIRLAHGEPSQVIFVDTMPAVNVWMRIGAFLSRKWNLIAIGRPLVIFGTRRAFYNFVRIVGEIKSKL